MVRAVCFLLTLLVTLALPAQELPRHVSFEHLSIPGTVRSSEVRGLIQDPEGLIWIASEGLVRYDGYSFTTFKILPDSSSIGGQEINCLLYDQQQRRILIGTRNHGIVEYRYETNSLRALPSRDGIPYVNAIVQDSDGKIWAKSFTSGVFYLEQDTLRLFRHPSLKKINPTAPYVWEDKLLIGAMTNILVFKNEAAVDSITLSWQGEPLNLYGRVTALCHDQQSKLYIGTEKEGVLIYDTRQKKFTGYLKPEEHPFYNRINNIHIDQKGLVWILTKGGGVAVYSPELKRHSTITKNVLDPNSLSHDNCLSILEDNTGIIWIGSLGDLNKYDAERIRFTHLTYNPLQTNSLSDKVVRGIFEDDEGYLLVGTDGGFINRVNPVTLAIEKIEVNLPGQPGIIVPFYFTDLDNEQLLISTNVGLLTMHKRNRAFRYYEPLFEHLGNTPVRQTVRHADNLYIISAGSFTIYNLKTRKRVKYYGSSPDPAFTVYNPTCIYLDSQQRLWLGVSGGVKLIHDDFSTSDFRLDTRTRRPEGNYFMVLSMNEINGKLWIGSFDSGLYELDISQGIEKPFIKRVSLPEDLNTTSVYSTLPDDEGQIWISTNSGLIQYNMRENQFTRFTLNEGLQDLEFNRLAFYKLRNGKLVFGGINGLNLFETAAMSVKSTTVKPAILSITGNGNQANYFHYDVRHASAARLAATQNSFTIQFITPNYENPNRLITEYRLLNYEDQWSASTEARARYSNLKPGEYTFQVRVRDHGSLEQMASIQVTISKPYWQTAWFISLILLSVGMLVYASVRIYIAKSNIDKQRLEKLLQERTREIERSRAELSNLNQKKDLIFSILSHDLRGPLTTLKGFLSLIIDNTDALPKEDIKLHANNIRNALNYSIDLLDNTLYWSLTQTGNIQYSPDDFCLNALVTKVFNMYKLIADQKNISLKLHLEENLRVHADENMIFVVLRNLVSNAIKFTKPGREVTITVRRQGENAIVSFIDEGVGMNTYYLEKLLSDDMPQIKTGTANEKGTGLGIVLCKNFIRQNKGEFMLNSVEKAGTEASFTLPLVI
jgi:signal transduction histidine kinase/ligand-binding sensor domain-containing protein